MDVATDHTATLNTDNAARNQYYNRAVPPTYDLGHHLFFYDGTNYTAPFPRVWNGRGSEFIGEVSPADFIPSEFGGATWLAREIVNGNRFWGPNGNEATYPSVSRT